MSNKNRIGILLILIGIIILYISFPNVTYIFMSGGTIMGVGIIILLADWNPYK